MSTTGGRLPAETRRWLAVRRELSTRRHQLTQLASRLYPGIPRVAGTPLLCRPEWVATGPVRLDAIDLSWVENARPPLVTGTEPEAAALRPQRPDGSRFGGYAEALAALDRPAVLENRTAYRLLAAQLSTGTEQLVITSGRYFDGVDVGEALAHELAAALLADPAAAPARQPFRNLVGDPCDLGRRSAIHAITTLTLIRRGPGTASFLLHWRDPAKVVHAGGLHQVIPVGIFQPADDNPDSERADLSLWRSLAREFSEELLGTPEDYRQFGSPLGYDRWPFYRRLDAARAAGLLSVWCVGLGVDPLTLAVDILAVAVFDATAFAELFGRLVTANGEGRVISGDGAAGIAFSSDVVGPFRRGEPPMQAAGAAVLGLAWRHRDVLLG
jgi:hypothetical protein